MSAESDPSDGDNPRVPTPSNREAQRSMRETAAEKRREQQAEHVELYGKARELFVSRYEDTFTLSIHDKTIEFFRPMDASDIDFASANIDPETAERIQRGSSLIDEFESRQEELLRAAQGGNASLEDLLDDSMDATELMCRILAAHAVDDSLSDAEVWARLFRNEEQLGDVFEDFIAEGDQAQTRQKLSALDGLMSDSSSSD